VNGLNGEAGRAHLVRELGRRPPRVPAVWHLLTALMSCPWGRRSGEDVHAVRVT